MGPSNQVAVSAVRAVLEQPGKKYNPLVLVGKSGLGKTHLLNALGLELVMGGTPHMNEIFVDSLEKTVPAETRKRRKQQLRPYAVFVHRAHAFVDIERGGNHVVVVTRERIVAFALLAVLLASCAVPTPTPPAPTATRPPPTQQPPTPTRPAATQPAATATVAPSPTGAP